MQQTDDRDSDVSKSAFPPVTPAQLRQLAVAHRRVVFSVLLQLVYWALMSLLIGIEAAIQEQNSVVATTLLMIYWTFALIYSLVAVYKLAGIVKQGQGIGILYAALMFVPIVSLFVLLSLSQKSIKALTRYSVRVGLMGADMNTIDTSAEKIFPVNDS